MSTALAIAATTAVLKSLLDNRFSDPVVAASFGASGRPQVTVLPPDAVIPANTQLEDETLNLFLYQVTPNVGWRNVGLPSRDDQGERVTNPPLALDLHYLLTAYGNEPFHAEMILGYGVQLLHEISILTRGAIRTALQGLPPASQVLATAELADQVEQIKLSPTGMSSEEISRLWSAFQTHYRPTAAYYASVVLIESRRPAKSALPVRDRRLLVLPFNRPVIETVAPQMALITDLMTLQGQNLKGEIVRVRFGAGTLATPDLTTITNTQLTIALPTGLLAGVNTVQVVHLLDFGTGSPSEPHRGFESNVAAFVLRPQITTVLPPPPALLTIARGSSLALSVTPPIGREQRVAVLLGDRAILVPARPPSDPSTATSFNCPIPNDFPIGVYLLRVQVDGAESPLDVDQNSASPTFNQYIGPRVQVT